MCISIALLVLLPALLGVAKDFNILKGGLIDNIIGIAALLCSISSIPLIKEKMGKIMPGDKFYKKCIYLILMLVLPYYIALPINQIEIANSISNTCGVIGIIIFVFTW